MKRHSIITYFLIFLAAPLWAQFDRIVLTGSRGPDRSVTLITTPAGSEFLLPNSLNERIELLETDLDGNGTRELVVLGDYGITDRARIRVLDPRTGALRATLEPSDSDPSLAGVAQLSAAFWPGRQGRLIVGIQRGSELEICGFRFMGNQFEADPTLRFTALGATARTRLFSRDGRVFVGLLNRNQAAELDLVQNKMGASVTLQLPFQPDQIQLHAPSATWWVGERGQPNFATFDLDGRLQNQLQVPFQQNYSRYVFHVASPNLIYVLGANSGSNLLKRTHISGLSVEIADQLTIDRLGYPHIWPAGTIGFLELGSGLDVSINQPEDGFITNQQPLAVAGTTSGEPETLTLNGQSLPVSATWSTQMIVDEGPLTLSAEVGGQGETARDQVSGIIDRTPPVIQISSPQNNALITQLPIVVQGTLADNLDPSPRLSFSGSPVFAGNGSWQWVIENLSNGTHQLQFQAVDHAGNQSSQSVQIRVELQTAQATLSVPAQALRGSSIQVVAFVPTPSAELVLPNGQSQTLGNGQTAVTWAIDPWELQDPLTFQLNTSLGTITRACALEDPPLELGNFAPANGWVTHATSVQGTGTVSPPWARVFGPSGQQLTVTNGVFQFQSPLAAGTNPLSFQAQTVERQAQSQLSYYSDQSPPQLNWNLPASIVRGSELLLALQATDDTQLQQIELWRDGALVQSWTSTQASWSGQYQVQVPFTDLSPQWSFTFRATDQFGQQAESLGAMALLPPDVTITIISPQPGSLTAQNAITISGTVSPADAPVVSLQGLVMNQVGDQWTAPAQLVEGNQTFEFQAELGGGIANAQLPITLDSLPPQIQLQVPSPVNQGEDIQVTWQVNDPHLDAQSVVVTQVLPSGSQVIASGQASGNHSFNVPFDVALQSIEYQVTAQDTLGHTANGNQTAVVVPPQIEIAILQPQVGLETNANEVQVTGTVNPPQATVTVDGVSAVVSQGTWQALIPLTGEGSLPIQAQAVLANFPLVSDQVSVFRDITPPVIAITAPAQVDQGTQLTFEWLVTDARPHALNVVVELDGTPISSDPQSQHVMAVAFDPNITEHTLQITADDGLNPPVTATHTVSINPFQLSVAVTDPPDGELTAATSIQVNGTVSESSAQVTLNGQSVTQNGTSWSTNVLLDQDGTHNLVADAIFHAYQAQDQRAVIRDATPPEITLNAPLSVAQGENLQFDWQITDAHLITLVEVRLDGQLISSSAVASHTETVPYDQTRTQYQIDITAHDELGNQSMAQQSVTVNPIQLSIQIQSPTADFLTDQTAIQVDGSVSHDGASVDVNGVAAVVNNAQFSAQVPLNVEGPQPLVATANFHAYSAQDQVNVIRDTLPPQVSLNAPASVQAGEAFGFDWTTADPHLAMVRVLVDGAVVLQGDGSGPTSHQLQTQLSQMNTQLVLRVEAEDSLGHLGFAETSVDVTAPVVAISFNQPTAESYVTTVPVVVSGSVTPAGAEVFLEGQSLGSGATTWTNALNLTDGPHTLTAEARLLTLTAQDTLSFTVDTQPPTVQINAPGQVGRGETLLFTVDAQDANPISQLLVRVEGQTLYDGPNASFSGSWPVPADFLSTSLQIQAQATDVAGLTGQAQQAVDVLDLNLELVVVEPPDPSTHPQADVTFSGTVSPVGAAVAVAGQSATVNGNDWNHVLNLADGTHQVDVIATYQTATPVTITRTVTVDTQPPVIDYQAPVLFVRGNSYTVTVTAQDPSGIQTLDVSLNGVAFPPEPGSQRTLTITVPIDEPLNDYLFGATATDTLGHTSSQPLTVPVRHLSELDRVQVIIDAPPHGSTFADPNQIVLGHVIPADATVDTKDQPIPVNPDGTFSHPVQLHAGVNTYIFFGRKEGYLDGVGKVDLYLDNTPPVVRITYPEANHRTNQPVIDIYGTVHDSYDTQPTLTRNGTPVSLTSGQFLDAQVPLVRGENVFTYIATDAQGLTGQDQITVFYEPQLPEITLNHAQLVRPGASFDVNASVLPTENIIRFQVSVDNQLVHDGSNGDPFTGSFVADGFKKTVPVFAAAEDSFGNRVDRYGFVQIAAPIYVHGRVLDNMTSYPVSGVSVNIATPEGNVSVLADANGYFEYYAFGLPVRVVVESNEYSYLARQLSRAKEVWRVPDLRLTPRNPSVQVADGVTVNTDNMSLLFDGSWSGTASMTEIGFQGIPELLPLGYSPIGVVEVHGATGSGSLTWSINNLNRLTPGTRLVLLAHEVDHWTVIGELTSQTNSAQFNFDNLSSEVFAVSARDEWTGAPTAEMGAQLHRDQFELIPANISSNSDTNPSRVSIIDEPSTHISSSFTTDGRTMSGAQCRIKAQESHQRIDGALHLPVSEFDLFCYSYDFGSFVQPSAIGGELSVRAVEEVSPDVTRSAEIFFEALPGEADLGGFIESPDWDLGNITISFNHPMSLPIMIFVRPTAPIDVPEFLNVTELIGGFDLSVGGTLPVPPTIKIKSVQSQNVIVLRRQDSEWLFVGQAFQQGDEWIAENLSDPILGSGEYAIVGISHPVSEIRGVVSDSVQPNQVRISNSSLPWLARSREDGSFATVVLQSAEPIEIIGYHQETRRSGSTAIAQTLGQPLLTGINLPLGQPEFIVVESDPIDGEVHLELIPRMSLTFNMPLTLDYDNLASNLVLTGDLGTVPLQIVPNDDRLSASLIPLQVLSPSSAYSLQVLPNLENLYGDRITSPQAVTFTTRATGQVQLTDTSRFHLRWDGSNMYLEAPAAAVVANSKLRIFNPSTYFTLELSLPAGAFSESIDAQVGDAIELSVKNENGEWITRIISLVQTAPNTYVLGTEPSRIQLDNGTELWVDGVHSNPYSEVQLLSIDQTQAELALGDVPAWSDIPPGGFLNGLEMVVSQPGTLPTISGRIVFPFDGQLHDNKDIHLLRVGEPQAIPVDPNDPTITAPISFGRVLDTQRITNGELVSKTKKTGSQKIQSIQEISLILSEGGSASSVQSTATRASIFTWGHDTSYQDPLTGLSKFVTNMTIDCLSAPADGINRQFAAARWHNQYPGIDSGLQLPVREAIIYRLIAPQGNVTFVPLGRSDITGRSVATWFGTPHDNMVGLDPLTGQLVQLTVISGVTVRDLLGVDLKYEGRRKAEFDPEQHIIQTGGQLPPRISVRWTVEDQIDSQWSINQSETAKLNSLNQVDMGVNRRLQAGITSSQPIGGSPTLIINGIDLSDDVQLTGSNDAAAVFPTSFCAQANLLRIALTVANQSNEETTVNPNILVVDRTQDCACPGGELDDRCMGAPVVIQTLPRNGQMGVPVDTEFYVRLNEPVSGVTAQNVTLISGGENRNLTFFDRFGVELSNELVCEFFAVPDVPLNFDAETTLTIGGLTDDAGNAMTQLWRTTFQTTELEVRDPDDDLNGELRDHGTDIWAYRNLILYLNREKEGFQHLNLHLFDVKNPYEDRKPLWVARLNGLRGSNTLVNLEVFLPHELSMDATASDYTAVIKNEESDKALKDLPNGSVIALVYFNYYASIGSRNILELYRYDGHLDEGDLLVRMPLSENTGPLGIDKVGHHLIQSFYGWAGSPGPTIVYDIQKILDPEVGFEALHNQYVTQQIRLSEYAIRLNKLGIVSHYPIPLDCAEITSFFRKNGAFFEPAFVISGARQPAVFPFDISSQPPMIGVAAGGDPLNLWDSRMLGRMSYFNNPNYFFNRDVDSGAAQRILFRHQTLGLIHRDVLVTTHRSFVTGDSYLEAYLLDPDMQQEIPPTPMEPYKRIHFTNPGISNIAVDRYAGFVAVQGRNQQLSVLDLRSWLESNDASTGFNHEAFMIRGQDMNHDFESMIMHQGTLIGVSRGFSVPEIGLKRILISPKTYRTVGWEYIDLGDWLSNPEANLEIKTSDHLVLQAADRPDDQLTKFKMEMGSYAVEMSETADIEFTWRTGDGTSLSEPIKISAVEGQLVTFNTDFLRSYYLDANNQKSLREKGVHWFNLIYEVSIDGTIFDSGETDVLVVYRSSQTRYRDPYRLLGEIDALSLMPDLFESDYQASNQDPRIDFSLKRALNSDYALQAGSFGVGMVNGQMLHGGIQMWWDVTNGSWPNGWHSSSLVSPSLVLEHPGIFQVEVDITSQGPIVTDLASTLRRNANSWVFSHREAAEYVLRTDRDWPALKLLFDQLNQVWQTAQNAAYQMRYPVVRFTAEQDVPPNWLGEIPVKEISGALWKNKIEFFDRTNKPTTRPNQIRERTGVGLSRSAEVGYEGSSVGSLVKNWSYDNQSIEYTYDGDGYLTEVSWTSPYVNYSFTQSLEWEPISINQTPAEVGNLVVKRLIRVQMDDYEIAYLYNHPDSMRISGVETSFGSEQLTILKDSLGLPIDVGFPEVQVGSTVITPKRGVTFAPAFGNMLSSSHKMGQRQFNLGWTKQNNGMRSDLLLRTDDYQNQRFEYTSLGQRRLHERLGQSVSWDYGNSGPLMDFPTSYTDAVGNTFTIDTTASNSTTSIEGENIVQTFSPSGTVIKTKGLDGFEEGANTDYFYVPFGGGYRAGRGLLKKVPIPGDSVHKSTEIEYDPFENIIEVVDMGAKTSYSQFDSLRRPREISYLNGNLDTIEYRYLDRQMRITTDSNGGAQVIHQDFNQLGWLISSTTLIGVDESTTEFKYDDLGRLIEVTDGLDVLQRISYHGDTNQPVDIYYNNDSSQDHYEVEDAYNPRVLSITKTVEPNTANEQSKQIVYETDALGRVIKRQDTQMGVALLSYDGWSRIKNISPEDPPPGKINPGIDFNYQNEVTTIDDRINETYSEHRRLDSFGLGEISLTRGLGVDAQIDRTLLTRDIIKPDDSGFVRDVEILGSSSDLSYTEHVNGFLTQSNVGPYEMRVTERNQFGAPKSTEYAGGRVTSSLAYDSIGRVTSATNVQSHTTSYDWDVRGRLSGGVDNRGKQVNNQYFGATSEPRQVDVEGPNVQGNQFLNVMERQDRVSSTSNHWLGAQRRFATERLGESWSVEKPGLAKNGVAPKATVNANPLTGRIENVTDFIGNTTEYEWENFGRSLTIRPPGSDPTTIEFDGLGQVRKITDDGLVRLQVSRDSDQRPTFVKTENRDYTYAYDGWDLSSVTGGRHPINFRNYNSLGFPEQVEIGDVLQIDAHYDQGVIPSCITTSSPGGLSDRVWYDSYGAVSQIQRGLRPPVGYSFNAWGAPASLTYLGNTYDLFDDQDLTTWHLPGGVTLHFNEEGQVERMETEGLAEKTVSYNGNGEVSDVLLAGNPYQSFEYQDGRVHQTTFTAFGQTEVQTHGYDAKGRLASLTRDGQPLVDLVYQDEHPLFGTGEIKNPDLLYQYTDPNGTQATYAYSPEGWLKSIDVQGGMTLHYDYDTEGNLTQVSVAGNRVQFTNWELGMPTAMSWARDQEVQSFEVIRGAEGRLERIFGGDYDLDLDWSTPQSGDVCAEFPLDHYPYITRIYKAGPGYNETWTPQYTPSLELESIEIFRSDGSTIDEEYGPVINQMPTRLARRVNGQLVLDLQKALDLQADQRRIESSVENTSGTIQALVYDELGNLRDVQTSSGAELQVQFEFTPTRRIGTSIAIHPTRGTHTDSAVYDHMGRRSSSSQTPVPNARRVYFYNGSQVIGLGLQLDSGITQWTHAIARGPFGPCMLVDLLGGPSYFLFTDHLGTPFAWQDMETGDVTYTPINPWGELLAAPASSPYVQGNVDAVMDLPEVAGFEVPPIGLAGHITDQDTGLIYMHHRFYSPRLGHFLTPDFRLPDIYDPSSFTEPYAYATANPLMFWDPDGLAAYIMNARQTTSPNYIGDQDEFINEWLDFSYEVARDAKGNVITQGDVVLGYDPRRNPTNTTLPKLLGDDVLVFIHGYNVTELSAIEKWTRKIYDRLTLSGFKGDVISLSWRGDEPFLAETDSLGESGTTLDPLYFGRNVQNARQTGTNLADLLLDIRRARRNAQINIIAHSLGNQVLLQGLEVARTNSRYRYLNLHNVVHLEAAADQTVYYRNNGFFDLTPKGEFRKVPSTVNRVINMYSEADDVLKYAYQADMMIRRAGVVGQLGPYGYPRALGLRGTPKPFKNSLPSNFVEIDAQPFGISSHSAMVDNPYRRDPNDPRPEVKPFWEELVRNLYKP